MKSNSCKITFVSLISSKLFGPKEGNFESKIENGHQYHHDDLFNNFSYLYGKESVHVVLRRFFTTKGLIYGNQTIQIYTMAAVLEVLALDVSFAFSQFHHPIGSDNLLLYFSCMFF